jgi:general secretion pathway protein H
MIRYSARAGFALVEILGVIMILSLVTAAATPLLRKPPASARLKADVNRMAAALRVTRAAAMAQDRAMDFVLHTGQRSYASPAVPASTIDPETDIVLAGANRGVIRFFPSGQSTGADLRFRLGTSSMRLQVIWATGHVRIDP